MNDITTPSQPPIAEHNRFVWTQPRLPAIGAAVIAALCAIFATGFAGLLLWVFSGANRGDVGFQALAAAMIGSLFVAFAWLCRYSGRDAIGKWGGSIVVSDAGIDLDLAPHRSDNHELLRTKLTLARSDIESVDTRFEAYRVLAINLSVRRSYRLRLHNGNAILLFEARESSRGMMPYTMRWLEQETGKDLSGLDDYQSLAQAIASRLGVPLLDFGLASGRKQIYGPASDDGRRWCEQPATRLFDGSLVLWLVGLLAVAYAVMRVM